MFYYRYLNEEEVAFISSRINKTKRLLLGLFIITALIIAAVAFFIYSDLDTTNYAINIMFGVLILLLYSLNWFVKGYKKHVVNTKVYKSKGLYKSIYQQHGKNGRYYHTINGTIIKIPWHWQNYLKLQKEPVSFEYIVRDGVVAVSEGASNYVVSLNDTLSLDYELQNGLKKAKPLSFLNLVSFVLIIPVIIILCVNSDVTAIQNFKQLLKTEQDYITLNATEEVQQIDTPSYIKINNAWVYQYKLPYDAFGENYVISKAERDRIYYNPSSQTNYRYHFPARALTKPDKENYKKQLEKNIQQLGIKKTTDTSLWENKVNNAFKIKLAEYKNRLFRAKKMDSILQELKPKSYFFKIKDTCFNAAEQNRYNIKSSLEKTGIVNGFYSPKSNTIIRFKEKEVKRKAIKNACILFCICALITIVFIMSIFKIIYNTILKKRLVEAQLNSNHGNPRIEK